MILLLDEIWNVDENILKDDILMWLEDAGCENIHIVGELTYNEYTDIKLLDYHDDCSYLAHIVKLEDGDFIVRIYNQG